MYLLLLIDCSSAYHTAWAQILGGRGDTITCERLQALFPEKEFLEEANFTLLHRTVVGLNSMDPKTVLENLSKPEIDEGDGHNRTALWWAAKRGDAAKVSILLRYRADINKASKFGTSPLQTAIKSGHQACTRIILEAGCSFNDRDTWGWLPIHLCSHYGSDADIVGTMLHRGADIDARITSSGGTPLLVATQENHTHLVEYLINQGADLNASGSDGETPLHVALMFNHVEALRLLLRSKASRHARTKAGATLLHHAAQFGSLECLKTLRAFNLTGVDPEAKITGLSPTQALHGIKSLAALQVAEKRTDVSPEWLNMFRRLLRGVESPDSIHLTSTPRLMTEAFGNDTFEDAVEHQE